jgi:thiol-disulfide isomerase/thioredoxin
MKVLLHILWVVLAFAFVGESGLALPEVSAKTESVRWIHRDGSASLRDLFLRELSAAKKEGKSVVVFFTADWCTPCKSVKDFLHESKVVQRAVKKGRFLFIDVDEWRGPAHRLFPGINPRKLPTLVHVDYKGLAVLEVKGTELGLLSEEDTGKNLKRLFAGKRPLPASYLNDPTKRKALMSDYGARAKKRKDTIKPVEVKILSQQKVGTRGTRYSLQLTFRNRDGMRRWFAVPTLGSSLTEMPLVDSWTVSGFQEHVRYRFYQYYGDPNVTLFQVGGNGTVVIEGWTGLVYGSFKEMEVWELRKVTADGADVPFSQKLPYSMTIREPLKTRVFESAEGQPQLLLQPTDRHRVSIR